MKILSAFNGSGAFFRRKFPKLSISRLPPFGLLSGDSIFDRNLNCHQRKRFPGIQRAVRTPLFKGAPNFLTQFVRETDTQRQAT